MRKSNRLSNDADTVRNLKEVLKMREKLLENQPGKTVNGRELLKPRSIKLSNKRGSFSKPCMTSPGTGTAT